MNILLTSVGRRAYLVKYFQEALVKNGITGKVFVANSRADSPAFSVADGNVVTPLIYDDGYIRFLLEYCKKNEIDAVLSLFDIDLPILAAHKNDFEMIGTTLVVSDLRVVEMCNDKWRTYNFLIENGIFAPNTYIEKQAVIKDLENGKLDYPVVIKPRWGCGSIGIFIAYNKQELEVLGRKCYQEIQSSHLKYESSMDAEKCVLYQEFVRGDEYGMDVINDLHGDFVQVIAKRKLAMRAGETDEAMTVDDENLKTLGEKIGKATKHIANMDVDVLRADGTDYVLEMNARFGGGYPFSHIAGVDLPATIVAWLADRKPNPEWLQEKVGVKAQKDINIVEL